MPYSRHTPYLIATLLIAAACSPLLLTPDDFPPPPLTVIVDFPTPLPATPTPRPTIKPIFADDIVEARTFFLILKVSMMAGDSAAVAERVQYPILVLMNGQAATIRSAAEFESNYEAIFTRQLQDAIAGADENDLQLGLDGIDVVGGALRINQFCADPACIQGQFLITQINN